MMNDLLLSIPTTIDDSPASADMLKRVTADSIEAEPYRPYIVEAAGIAGVPPCVIMGMLSRESGAGLLLTPPGCAGTGDGGHGRGLMQIDDRWHEFARTGAWKDPHQNIVYGAHVLHDSIRYLELHTGLRRISLLAAGVAGYNCGPGNAYRAVSEGRDVDTFTANHNYSKDVLNRAGWFQRHGWS